MARENESRLKILVVSSALFAKEGYSGASIRKIGKICGLQQPSIYHHFWDKEHLYAQAIKATRQLMIRVLRDCLVKTEDLATELYSYFLVFQVWREVFEGTLFPGEISVMTHFLTSAPSEMRKETGYYIDRGIRRLVKSSFRRYASTTDTSTKENLFITILYGFIFQYSNLTIGKFKGSDISHYIELVIGSNCSSENIQKARKKVRHRLERLRKVLLDGLHLT